MKHSIVEFREFGRGILLKYRHVTCLESGVMMSARTLRLALFTCVLEVISSASSSISGSLCSREER